jgi:hypothetical protein
MIIHFCHSDTEADWSVAYHTQLNHKNIQRIASASGNASVASIQPDPNTQYKPVGKYFEPGVKWIVTADP